MTETERFFDLVSTDKSLRQELSTAIGGKEGKEALEAIVELAQLKGFNATVEEAIAAVSARLRENNADRELNDADLEGVSGGFFPLLDELLGTDIADTLGKFGINL